MGKKVLITESQAKLLLEEIDKNDSIQKLLFCEPTKIKFDDEQTNANTYKFNVIIDGKKIDERFISLLSKVYNINGKQYHQLYIEVPENLRRAGIAYNICLSLIKQGYNLCMLNKKCTPEFKNLWKKLMTEKYIYVGGIYDTKNKQIGLVAQKDKITKK